MAEHASSMPRSRERWRTIVDFPLVSMLIAITLFALALTAAKLIVGFLPHASNVGLWLRWSLEVALVLAAYKLVIVHLGERPRDDLRLRGAGGSLAVGLVLGVVLFCLLVGIAALFGVYHVVGNGNASELLPDLVAIGIVPAFLEELLFRGIIFRWLEEFGGSWLALALTSGLFGAAHAFNPGATWWSALAIVVEAGVLLGSAYMLARNLWAPMGLHGAWNFTQGFVFGAPVSGMSVHGLIQAKLSGPVLLSGGAFGLEASMIGVVLSLPLGTGILILTVQRGGLFQPWWVRRRDRCAKT